VLNCGNLFFREDAAKERKGAVIFQALAAMGTDVIAPGRYDLVFGIDFLGKLATAHGIAMTAANLRGPEGPPPGFTSHALITRGGMRILITGIMAPRLENLLPPGCRLVDPEAEITTIRQRVPHDCFILVVHGMEDAEIDHLGRQIVDLDLLVIGDRPGICNRRIGELPRPLVIGNNSRGGQQVAWLDLAMNGGGMTIFGPRTMRLAADPKREDGIIAAAVADYERWRAEFFQQNPPPVAKPEAVATLNAYLGAGWCKRCHAEINERWAATAHARAFGVLRQMKREHDPECVACHVTGGFPPPITGSFQSPETSPRMLNVQCEACHGPAGRHVMNPDNNPLEPVTESTCRRCHTPATDPTFDFAADRKSVNHGQSAR
jgi:hypothetical protein